MPGTKLNYSLLAVAVVGVAGAAWLLLRGGSAAPDVVPVEEGAREQGMAPQLAEGTSPRPPARPIVEEPPAKPAEDDSPAADDVPKIHGVVLDGETGKPVAGAVVLVEAALPTCPRMPASVLELFRFEAAMFRDADPRPIGPMVLPHAPSAVTTAEGAFAVPFAGFGDVFAHRAGYVLGTACGAGTRESVLIRLQKGLTIEGVVVRGDGTPIAKALVQTAPAPGTPIVPGRVEMTPTDDQGRFALTGLVPGPLIVSADHPRFVASALPPMEPPAKGLRIVLTPALVTTFVVGTDDGKDPDAPSVAWSTAGLPSRTGLQLLDRGGSPTNEPGKPIEYAPVKVPCDRPTVTFTVKSVGYSPWVSEPEPLPPDGGEKRYEVTLQRDLSLGSVKLTFEDRDGRVLSYAAEGGQVQIGRRDGKAVPAGIIVQPGEALELPALPAGPYLLRVLSPKHAPADLSLDVPAGSPTEQRVVLGAAAKLRVKFVSNATERVTVRFRVMNGRLPEFLFQEAEAGKAAVAQGKDGAGEPDDSLHAGEDGTALITGLPAGRRTVEVISPDLTAPATPVDLAEGETREVEIAVSKR